MQVFFNENKKFLNLLLTKQQKGVIIKATT